MGVRVLEYTIRKINNLSLYAKWRYNNRQVAYAAELILSGGAYDKGKTIHTC